MVNWVEACSADDIEEEDVIRFDYGGRTFATIVRRKTNTSRPTASVRTSTHI
jgi:nitrite reductase/ring-hydroxylating ferredoxin subunit